MRYLRCLLWMACVLFVVGQSGAAQAQDEWRVGALVGLRAGTCIREGPGFAYRAHTRVPEDDWTVMVIDGPRFADGHTWWDTSRKAAGDPSGGTGWVTQDQTDTDCPIPVVPAPVVPIPVPAPASWTAQVAALWRNLPEWARWGAAVIMLLVGLRVAGRTLGWLLGLLNALLGSVVIWIVLSLTRIFWEPLWHPLGQSLFGTNVPDLAFLLAMLPLAAWLLSTVGRLVRRI